jgi:hypothetical protein
VIAAAGIDWVCFACRGKIYYQSPGATVMSQARLANVEWVIRRGVKLPADPLYAMSLFMQAKDPANVSLRRLVRRLTKAKIPHAVMGGLAVYAHGYHRMTIDVDVLLTREGFEQFRRLFVPKNYAPVPGRSRRFHDRQNNVTVDILVTGLYPGLGKPGPIAFPDPESVRQTINSIHFVNFVTLIQLKLAARRYQDLGDVVNLIRENNLDKSFVDRLHPSLRRDFIECLEEKLREDEYEARQ